MKAASQHRTELIETLSISELSDFCHVQVEWVTALVDYGVLEPQDAAVDEWHFTAQNVLRARKARRLMHDLGLNLAGVALVLDLIEERDALARRLAQIAR